MSPNPGAVVTGYKLGPQFQWDHDGVFWQDEDTQMRHRYVNKSKGEKEYLGFSPALYQCIPLAKPAEMLEDQKTDKYSFF